MSEIGNKTPVICTKTKETLDIFYVTWNGKILDRKNFRRGEQHIHHSLKRRRSVRQAERHYFKMIQSIRSDERCLFAILRLNFHLPVAGLHVHN